MPRALVTGVSGFVGGHLAEHLLAAGDEVLGTSPNGDWSDASPRSIRGRIELVPWDFTGTGSPSADGFRTIERFAPEVIYHLAALSIPGDCGREDPTPRATAINVEGTRRVAELAAGLARPPRLLLASTSHVYAPVAVGAPPVDENGAVAPRNAYGKTKLAAEREVLAAVGRGLDAVILRAFPHTGPGQGPAMMLPQWASQFARGSEPVEVHTRGARIDLCDVRDVVRAYRLLAGLGRSGEVYNVGSGVARTSGEVLDLLRELADPARVIVEIAPSVKQDPISDTRRLVRETGWRAMIPIDKTVADTWQYWRERMTAN
jgi:GDP-4-dehydro-6-deoxy-D-mannose reductase